jgi:hypothetical protein
MTPRPGPAFEADVHICGPEPSSAPLSVGALERLPKWLNLVPMVVQWLWLAARYGSVTLPGAANPAISAGGLAGEGKSEYFRIMGPLALSHTADFTVLDCEGAASERDAEQAMQTAGLTYPLILKPDIGWCGFGVRLVRDSAGLRRYLEQFPRGERIILQRFVPYEGEAGIYYVRQPGEAAGNISGILLRFFPRVVGDGRRTVAELIADHPRAQRLGRDGRSEPCCDPLVVPDVGEHVRVSITGSTRVGGLYVDASSEVTPALERAINSVATDMEQLHVARFDVRYESLGVLLQGKSFKIIEVNGAGSEAVHAWDPRYTLRQAYGIVFEKQRRLFAVGAAMRKRGHPPPSARTLARSYLRQAKLIRSYPPSN